MDQKNTIDDPAPSSTPYEPPAIESSASFERLALMCSRTPAEVETGDCLLATQTS